MSPSIASTVLPPAESIPASKPGIEPEEGESCFSSCGSTQTAGIATTTNDTESRACSVAGTELTKWRNKAGHFLQPGLRAKNMLEEGHAPRLQSEKVSEILSGSQRERTMEPVSRLRRNEGSEIPSGWQRERLMEQVPQTKVSWEQVEPFYNRMFRNGAT